MAYTTITELKQMTHLPANEISKSDGVGRALRIVTPHRGEVVIEYHEQGIFREKNVDMGPVLQKIRRLEHESKDYLLGQWLRDYYNPHQER